MHNARADPATFVMESGEKEGSWIFFSHHNIPQRAVWFSPKGPIAFQSRSVPVFKRKGKEILCPSPKPLWISPWTCFKYKYVFSCVYCKYLLFSWYVYIHVFWNSMSLISPLLCHCNIFVCYSNIIHILVVVFQSFQCVLYNGMLLHNAKGDPENFVKGWGSWLRL